MNETRGSEQCVWVGRISCLKSPVLRQKLARAPFREGIISFETSGTDSVSICCTAKDEQIIIEGRGCSPGRRRWRNLRKIPQPNEVSYAFAGNRGPNITDSDLAHRQAGLLRPQPPQE